MDQPVSRRWALALRRRVGERLSAYLSETLPGSGTAAPTRPASLLACLRPGDVVLVEGRSRISVAIKYLTQSTWSHAALYVGRPVAPTDADGAMRCFVEADLREGVRAVRVAAFAGLHCRVCRPVGLAAQDVEAVIRFVTDRIGHAAETRRVRSAPP
jgi:hypothetical protein